MSHILLIEPNTLLSIVYKQKLLLSGFSVDAVLGAQAAIQAADERMPDVIILEIQLPRHNGIEFLHELRSYSDWSHLPVIVHTMLTPAQLGGSVFSLKDDMGVKEVLYKPLTTLDILVQTVHMYTGGQA